jgi:anthranilate synthase/aminodeoxychorismate synthase-like glutamine amidotransferase
VRVLFAENHDSFTWNVIDRLPFDRAAIEVVPGRDLAQAPHLLDGADALVIGPGPTDPERAGLTSLVLEAARRRLPLLGVCLGHQAIGLAFGARLTRVPPVHGKVSRVRFAPSRSFPAFAGEEPVMRYHSLAVADVREPLRVVAELDGVPMALEHRELPIAGVQFHPDSFATPRGAELIAGFFEQHGVKGRAPPASPARGPWRDLPAPPPAERMRLEDVDALPSFALLGPGFGGGFSLVAPLAPSTQPRVVLAPYEGAQLGLDGPARAVELELPPPGPAPWVALDAGGHAEAVAHIRARIQAGDVYQVCHTERATVSGVGGADLLARLCRRGVPRFAAWLRHGDLEVVSASPELLLEVQGARARSEPMKGTAPAGLAEALRASEKDRAELAMITDLTRNDLASVCLPRSVEVLEERSLRELPYAVQAVSLVEGVLPPGAGWSSALAALFPGGSVTGAPKAAAREILAALERSPRGPYCGALGLVDGERAVFSLLIRTAWRRGGGPFTYGVGGGIVIDSDPASELAELRTKLGALIP